MSIPPEDARLDARWLFDEFSRSPIKRDVKIGRGAHLMHLEAMRFGLWRQSIDFLLHNESEVTHMPAQEKVNIPGYNPGSNEVAKSPITMDDWEKLKQPAFFSDEDIVYLRLSHDVLKDQVPDLLKVARNAR